MKHKAHGRLKLSHFHPDLRMRGLPKPKRFGALEKEGGEHHHESQYMVYQNLQNIRDYSKKVLASLEDGAGDFPAWVNHKLSAAMATMKDVTHWLRYQASRGRRYGGSNRRWYGSAGVEPGGRGGFTFSSTDSVSPLTAMYIAKSNLRHLHAYAAESCNLLEVGAGTLPQWSENKLALVSEYLDCIFHFIENEMAEGRRYGRTGGGARGRSRSSGRRAGPRSGRRPGRRGGGRARSVQIFLPSRRPPLARRIPFRRRRGPAVVYPYAPQTLYVNEPVALPPASGEVVRIDGYPFKPEFGTVVMPLNVLNSPDSEFNGKVVQIMRHDVWQGQPIGLARLPTGEMVWIPVRKGNNA